MDIIKRFAYSFVLILIILTLGCHEVAVKDMQEESISGSPKKPAKEDPILGPQSQQSLGEQRVLVVAVRFPDVQPRLSLQQIRRKAVQDLDRYVREQSYGLTWVKADFKGWIRLPDAISEYRVSAGIDEIRYQQSRIRKLIEDTMTAIEEKVNFANYQHMFIIPGAAGARSEKGYGTNCYNANPGLLARGTKIDRHYETLESKRGKMFSGGVFVGVEIAHLGMYAHDFFHALGGIYEGRVLVPDLYSHRRQADAARFVLRKGTRSEPGKAFSIFAIYAGPWDIMSQHYYKRREPPVGISSFTKIRLGWISSKQVVLVHPGNTGYAFLSPLSKKGDTLVVKIPLEQGRYYLIENRQPIRYDRILPDSGILILKVDPQLLVGFGPVKIMDADQESPQFSHATFRLDRKNRNMFSDRESNVAIIPLWSEEGNQGVLVTSAEKSSEALRAALMIEKLRQTFPEPRGEEEKVLIEECIATFKRFDFKRSFQIAQQAF